MLVGVVSAHPSSICPVGRSDHVLDIEQSLRKDAPKRHPSELFRIAASLVVPAVG